MDIIENLSDDLIGYAEHCRDEACSGTEFQNAYALSARETQFQNDEPHIDGLVSQGRYVVYAVRPAFCPFTDGLLGAHIVYVSDFATFDEALDDAGTEEDGFAIRSPRPVAVAPVAADDDNIPF